VIIRRYRLGGEVEKKKVLDKKSKDKKGGSMKGIKVGGIVVACFLWIITGYAQEELLLDSFEGRINSYTVDLEKSKGSEIKVSGERKLKVCGKQSMKVEFEVKSLQSGKVIGEGFVRAGRGYGLKTRRAGRWLVKPRRINWDKFNAISFMCYGRNSKAIIKFGVRDVKGEVWKFIFRDDFKGWKEIIAPFEQFYMRREEQPEGLECNTILDFPLKSFFFEFVLPGKDVYYFDCVKLKHVKIPKKMEGK